METRNTVRSDQSMAPIILADSRLVGIASQGFRVFGRS